MVLRAQKDYVSFKFQEKKSYFSRAVSSIRVEGSVKQALEMMRVRMLSAIIIFCLAFASVSVRLFEVVLFSSQEEIKDKKELAEFSDVQFERGDIVDRNGVLLASNLSTASLYANPKELMNPKETAQLLAQTLPGLNHDDLLAKLTSKKSFIWIKRNLTPKEEYEVNNLGQPGLYFRREEKRVYPHGRLMAHFMGYVGTDGRGLAGLEKQFDKFLSSDKAKEEPLKLSIDIRVQDIVHQELAAAMNEFSAVSGGAIVMDADNGEVVAAVSMPDYDPNIFQKSTPAQRFNSNTLGVYEMGSVFKSFNIAIGLDTGKISLNNVYDASTPIKIGGFTISDFHAENRPLDVAEIFMYSSNIGSAKIALDIGPSLQKEYLEKLGLLDELEIEVPEKGSPIYPKIWRKINSMTISYGHGIAVTPMHMVAAMAPVANGGIYHVPTLLKKTEEQLAADQGTRVLKKSTSLVMRKLLRLVVEHGTGKKADAEGYLVGGKTGTAEKLTSSGGYSTSAKLSSFIGVFPVNNPRYVLFVVLDDPKGTKETGGYATGGMTAAPVVAKVVEKIGPMLGIMPVNKFSKDVKEAMAIDFQKKDHAAN